MDFGIIKIALGIVISLILLISIVVSMWKKVPQDKAIVISGLRNRVVKGAGTIIIPVLERYDMISLESMKLNVRTEKAITQQGVEIKAEAVAVIKVMSDDDSIRQAIEQFNTGKEDTTIAKIKEIITDILDGKLREIISKMDVEEIVKDREAFSGKVADIASQGLTHMGLEIKAFTIIALSDSHGYLESLGKGQIAIVKRNAEIQEADAHRETQEKTAEARRKGKEAELLADARIAEAEKTKEVDIQTYNKEKQSAKAQADLAYEIEKNKTQEEVIETEMAVKILTQTRQIEVHKQQALAEEQKLEVEVKKKADADKYKVEKESEAEKYKKIQEADAKKYQAQNEADVVQYQAEKQAEATKIKAIAEAEATKQTGLAKAQATEAIGLAEAKVIKEKALAEVEGIKEKAKAYQEFGQSVIIEKLIATLPDIAREVASPLAKTEKIVMIDNGGSGKSGASKITSSITDIMAQMPEIVKSLTGVDLISLANEKLRVNKIIDIKDDKEEEAKSTV